jgi:hypothetical protein
MKYKTVILFKVHNICYLSRREDEEEGVRSLLDNLKEKRRYWKLRKRKHYIALCGEISLEEGTDLS